jgi:Tol biopolymer transport system component
MSPQQTIAHYRITSKLGEGGMGEVWRATDTKLNRDIAIKILPEAFAGDPDRMARFEREAQVLASLNHPNIATIYGVEERALIMELVEGPTLAERISQGPIPRDEALPIARQIAEALEYAHERGVIHRDLKPANIKITPEGRVKVLDFGLAKALSNEPAAADPAASPTLTMRATVAGIIMGTAAYMAPEQARGAAADRRADIWSFGVVLYEMLAGGQMFGGDTVSDTLAAVLKTDPDWSRLPQETPEPIRRLLRRCLERDRRRRLPDIAVARLEIDDALTAPAPPAPAGLAAPSRLGWWTAAISLIASAGVILAVVHFREAPTPPAPLRFQIPAPEKTSFGPTGIALSPDGRRLAFIAGAGTGPPMVWVRPLDALAAQPLRGTEDVQFLPFWSPDGRYVGFAVQGKLKKIEVSGGPAQTLCEVPGSITAGTWSRDGVILFSTAANGIFRVSQAGGVPVEVTKLDASLGEVAHMRPWFLPDGRHFLYVNRTATTVGWVIYIATLDGHQRHRLVDSVQAGAYAPPAPGSEYGHLLFMREGTLMAQPLDVKRGELAGDAFPVAEQVGSYLAMGVFTVSENGVLAYRSGSFGADTQPTWFDRQGNTLALLGPPGFYPFVALSPDGKRVAVSQGDGTGKGDIWMFDAVRGVPSRFTFSGNGSHPVWSPDGTRLVFASAISNTAMYQKASGGAGNEELVLRSAHPSSWSPDGKYLLYGLRDPKTNGDLWLLPVTPGGAADGKPAPYLQTTYNERQGQFSPNGRWVAYISDDTGHFEVYVQPFPAGGGKFLVSSAGGSQPRWSRNGKEIFYIAPNGMLMAADVKTSPTFEHGPPKALFDSRIPLRTNFLDGFRYDVAPDGKRFLVIASSAEAEGSASTPITVVVNWQAALKR